MKVTHKLAVLAAALALGSAAQAQSSVTLYGILDGGLRYQTVSLQNQDSATNAGMAYGSQSANRLGFRGVEDLGNGNRVAFTIESGFDLGNGNAQQGGRMFGRQAWLGAENDAWGYARMGRQYNFATDYMYAVDPMGQSFGQGSIGAAFGTANINRVSNMVKYQTPRYSGFQAGVGYSFATGTNNVFVSDNRATTGFSNYNFETNNNVRQATLGANYANGPVYVALTYDKVYAPTNAPTAANPSAWILGGAYDLKSVKLSAAYGQTRGGYLLGQGNNISGAGFNVNDSRVAGNGEYIFDQNMGYNSYLLGATVPVNSTSRVLMSWTMLTPNTNMKDAYNAQNQSAYNLAYTYDFSKRTNLYSYVSYMDNLATVDTAKSTVVGVGIRHQF
jgi:GBP family porin